MNWCSHPRFQMREPKPWVLLAFPWVPEPGCAVRAYISTLPWVAISSGWMPLTPRVYTNTGGCSKNSKSVNAFIGHVTFKHTKWRVRVIVHQDHGTVQLVLTGSWRRDLACKLWSFLSKREAWQRWGNGNCQPPPGETAPLVPRWGGGPHDRGLP